jgi:hypothetical protein
MPRTSTRRISHLTLLLLLAATWGIVAPQGGVAVAAEEVFTEEPSADGPKPGSPESYFQNRETVFKAFYGRGLDLSKAYAVTNLPIKKDNMTLLLEEGTLFLMKPIEGEITGAAFIGQGVATMTPPNVTERYMLNKHYGREALDERFDEAVFRFTDGTDRVLLGKARAMQPTADGAERATEIFKDRNSWLNGTRSLLYGRRALALEMQHLENRITGLRGQDFFVSDFHSAEHKWILYIHNPAESIENVLSISKTMGAKSRRYLVIWTEWHRQEDYGPKGHYLTHPDQDGPRVLRVRHSEMQMNVPTTDVVEWEGSLRIEPQVSGLRCLRFDLVNNGDFRSRWWDDNFFPVKLHSVTDESNRPLEFMHKKDQLLVNLPAPTTAGEAVTLHFAGEAKVIVQLTAQSFGLIQHPWFPQYGYLGGRYTFDWTVRVPKTYLIAGSGNIVREFEDKERKQNVLQMKSDLPVSGPWLIFGRFKKAENSYVSEESSKTVSLTIHSFPIMSVTITDPNILEFFGYRQPVTRELSAPLKKLKGFFGESNEILKLFENVYGPYPYDELHIAQMAPQLDFGQGPPGFLQLTGLAFMSQAATTNDFIHGFLSHEMAHQWWGNQVGWASGDDEWLSEGFAEYAAGIFVRAFQGESRFQQKLKDWRTDAKMGDPEGPIAAANTFSGPNADDYRKYLLYKKAPYVLHMLRVQLDDEKYSEVMKSVLEKYRHRNISTEMLLAEVNRVTGQDYTYFFDQWFWDVGIPRFSYSWRSERRSDGKYLITVHIKQADPKHVKRVLMPIYLHFKKGTIPQYRGVVEANQEIKILAPEKPKNVTLDDERTLLAEFVKD